MLDPVMMPHESRTENCSWSADNPRCRAGLSILRHVGIPSVALSPRRSAGVHLLPCGMPLSLRRQILRSWSRRNTKNMQFPAGTGMFLLVTIMSGPHSGPFNGLFQWNFPWRAKIYPLWSSAKDGCDQHLFSTGEGSWFSKRKFASVNTIFADRPVVFRVDDSFLVFGAYPFQISGDGIGAWVTPASLNSNGV
jgi:hypothetical protein